MNHYIDYFRTEAKNLLKSYKSQDAEAIQRCQKVFGDRTDLSLMNIQHVIAQENGYKKWNDILNSTSSEIAQKLIDEKNKTLTNHLTKWFFNHDITDFEDRDKTGDERELSKDFLEFRKNPGLGIKKLHQQGFLGQNTTVAFIEPDGLGDHVEYHNNLVDFIDISETPLVGSPRANDFVSSVVGKTCGLAPKAKCYFISAYSKMDRMEFLLKGLQKVIEIQKELLEKGIKGIDVVATRTACDDRDPEYQTFISLVKELNSLGTALMTGGSFIESLNSGYVQLGIYAPDDKNPDHPNDYQISKFSEVFLPVIDLNKTESKFQKDKTKVIYFPSEKRTCASLDRMNAYEYTHAVPGIISYAVGLFLLCKSIKKDLSSQEFYRLCFETGDPWKYYGHIVNPEKLLRSL